jgi:hypothetical protein
MMLRSAIALVALGGLAGSAMAGITETLKFGGAIFPMHASGTDVDDPLFQSKVLTGTSGTPIIGFTVTFDYGESVDDASWASDAAMTVDFVGTTVVSLGGTFGGMGRLGGTPDMIWSFDGSGSNAPGTYSTTFFFDAPLVTTDSIEISLTDTFNGGNSFTSITLDLIMVPTPGAVALFGLAGIAGIRRRR